MRNKLLLIPLMLLLTLTFGVSSTQAQMKSKMKYLVIGDFIDPGPMMAPPQVVQMMEHAVLPSLDMLVKWEADKRITGGVYVGDRKCVFIVDAESNEEVGNLVQSLPFWGLLKWSVSPLQSFSARAVQDKLGAEKMKSMTK